MTETQELEKDPIDALEPRLAGLARGLRALPQGQWPLAFAAAQLEAAHAPLADSLRGLVQLEREAVFHAAVQAPGVMRARALELPAPPARIESYLTAAEGEPLLRDLPQLKRRPVTQYVVADAPGLPVLRPLRHPLYDTLIVPESGVLAEGRGDLFADCRWFPDHTPKTEHDCNLTMSGCLGCPLEYDLSYFELQVEKFAHPDDVRRVLRGLVFKWIRGQNPPWLRVTLSGFEPYYGAETDQAKVLAAWPGEAVWLRHRHDAKTPEGEPQRIHGTESFRVEAASKNIGELRGPVRLKFLLQDTLYAQL